MASNRKNQNGNALFLILIAVALFAALSYAVTSSGRGSGSIDKETALIKSAQVTDYSAYLAQVYLRMTLTGTAPANIRYYNATLDDTCKTGTGCLFAPEGGGAKALSITDRPFGIEDSSGYGAGGFVMGSGHAASPEYSYVSFIGTDLADTFIELDYVSKNICTAINKGLGSTGPIPVVTISTDVSGVAVYAGTLVPGQAAGCFDLCDAPNPCYIYIHVIEER